jgi:hypothetical protein
MADGLLDGIAGELVQKAIERVANHAVGAASEYEVNNHVREMIRDRAKQIMAEPEVEKLLREKMIEIIRGLPASLPKPKSW